jgi:hypothetical protein
LRSLAHSETRDRVGIRRRGEGMRTGLLVFGRYGGEGTFLESEFLLEVYELLLEFMEELFCKE